MRNIQDEQGRSVSQLDPVRQDLLHLESIIPADTLRMITDELLPGARRQRRIQLWSMALSFALVVGGTFAYFRYFSSWKGFDLVNTSIYLLQALLIFGTPFLVLRQAQRQYAGRVKEVMLRHRRCPHCGYDLRGSVRDAKELTRCPECGCVWTLTSQ